MLRSCGISDVFWSHTTRTEDADHHRGPRRHPFPLFPVEITARQDTPRALFYFVGARSDSYYLTNTRNWILEHLSHDPIGIIIGRDRWHYDKIVHDLQIHNRVDGGKDQATPIDQFTSSEYRHAMADAVFALCPSGLN